MSLSPTSNSHNLAAKLIAAVDQLTPDARPRSKFLHDLSSIGPKLAAATVRGISYESLADQIFEVYGHRLKPESLRKRLALYTRAARSSEVAPLSAPEQKEVTS